MKKIEYNDNELIYLFQTYRSEVALNTLLKKYEPLIITYLKKWYLGYFYDDAKQECMMLLYETICKYNLDSDKTFNRFFDLILQRNIYDIVKKFKIDIVSVDCDLNQSNITNPFEYTIEKKKEESFVKEMHDSHISKVKKALIKEVFLGSLSPKEFALKYRYDIKYVYNQIYALKVILKKISND